MSTTRGSKVVVAVSGGVDSSVAACLLHEQGYDVIGLFMRMGIETPSLDDEDQGGDAPARTHGADHEGDSAAPRSHHGCCSATDASDARTVAGKLNVPFFALNFREPFDRLIDYFADEYARGRTPNPCILCNHRLKFGRLAEYAAAVGADFIATGHHARIERRDGQYRLCRALDTSKDQSYVLFGIGRDTLARTLLPVGQLTKQQVRAEARRFGLAVCDKPESQDICFVPDRDYARLVRQRRPDAFVEGPIIDTQGRELGRHAGIPRFTIGQRRGLGVAAGSPVYVTKIDAAANTVTLGPREQLAADTLTASGVRWLVDPPTTPIAPFTPTAPISPTAPSASVRAHVQIRYSHRAAPATIELIGPDRVRVTFDQPQYAIAPGQAAVFYHADTVLGGGWID